MTQETPNTRTFYSVLEIKQANTALGHHWFEPSSMRFFRSRIGDTVYFGRYFISSEQQEWNTPRRYSIRVASDDGSIDTLGTFMGYATRGQALAALKRYVQLEEKENAHV